MKYLSSDRIVTWSVHRLCSFTSSFTSRFKTCNPTNIRGVAIENPQISLRIGPFFTATHWISVRWQIWMLEVKELIILHNLHTDHVAVWSELTYLIVSKADGTVKLGPRFGSNPAKFPWFYVRAGQQPTKIEAVPTFGRLWDRTEINRRPKPRPLAGYPDPLLILGRRCINYGISWHTTRAQTHVSSPRCCQCSHETYHPGCPFENLPQDWKQQKQEAGYSWVWVYPYQGKRQSINRITYSGCLQRAT